MSAPEKSPLCDSLSVNVNESVLSLLLAPLLTSAAVIVIVGDVLSIVKVAPEVGAAVTVFPATSVPSDNDIVCTPSPAGT